MVLWIGVDDTDSLQGMCTTFLATELVRALLDQHDLVGYPRIVRLNPNIPWKTRGNAAICIRIGEGRGKPRSVGRIGDCEVLAYPRGAPGGDVYSVASNVARVVETWSCFDEPSTNPGFSVLSRPADPGLYWRTVREIVTPADAVNAVRDRGVFRGYKNGRGLVGAIAATAWRPHDRTYEVLAYRARPRWGERRDIDPESVIRMDRAFPSTFNNFDYENHRVVIAPRTPCPVLFGIRGDRPEDLVPAMRMIGGESPERWLVFETNQGTDDHVTRSRKRIPGQTVRIQGRVATAPRIIQGGHVVVHAAGIDITAYEPSKQFRSVVRSLWPGDRVEVIGAVREQPLTVNLEKLRVVALAPRRIKVSNPICVSCSRRTKSMGHGQPYRCAACRTKLPRTTAVFRTIEPRLAPGWYEPPAGSRRHLSKPLKRMIQARDRSNTRGGHLLDSDARNPVPSLDTFDDL